MKHSDDYLKSRAQWDAGDAAARAWVAQSTPEEIARFRDACDGRETEHQAFFGGEPVDRTFAGSFYNTVDGIAKGPIILALEAAADDAAADAYIDGRDAETLELEAEAMAALGPWLARFEDPKDDRITEALALIYVRLMQAQGFGWRVMTTKLRSPCRMLDIEMPPLFKED